MKSSSGSSSARPPDRHVIDARELAAESAAVVITDILDDEGEALAAVLSAAGRKAAYLHLDVTDEGQWRAAVEAAVKLFGRLDILVNNTGIIAAPDVETETIEGWNRVIATNQTGPWLGMKAAVPSMRSAGGGSIVNISSIFGTVGGFGGGIAYHASKPCGS